ncbi:MAG TPA: mannose-1-phosphate guanylyltransferase [Candidatus Acidoferrales bacterium]
MKRSLPACAVLLAGGRGTRFWPRSRTRTPKQILNIVGTGTMLGETAARLAPLVLPKNIWVVTNVEQIASVRRELKKAPVAQILAEPVGRNTAAAIGLAAVHLVRKHGDALMAVLPSDAHIADAAGYRKLVAAALEQAQEPGRMVVLGITPTRPETGYGYIERGGAAAWPNGTPSYVVHRFTEKPELEVARKYLASGKYFWNAGMFFWRATTFLENLQRFLPVTHEALGELAETIGTRRYAATLERVYPQLENISVDYAVMERATRARGTDQVSMIPADIGWSDVGSWAAVYELLAQKTGDNVSAGAAFTLDAQGNYFWSPKKFVAAIGVNDMVLVETDDAMLLCARERSQDVGKIVKWLEEQKRKALL